MLFEFKNEDFENLKNYCPFQKENLINKTKLYYPNKINK